MLKETLGLVRRDQTHAAVTKSALDRKFERLLDMTEGERATLRELQTGSKTIEARKTFIHEEQKTDETILVLEGWVARYKSLEDGRRQIVSFVLPGDFINLYAALFETSEESFRSLTKVVCSPIKPDILLELFQKEPRLATLLCWSAGRADAILAEHIVRVGRRSAYEGVGHLLLELLIRLEQVGLATSNSFEFPLTQETIADTLGLSLVHVNRTLKRLRKDQLIKLSDECLTVIDLPGLVRASKFDRSYLENRNLPDTFMAKLFA